MVHSPCVIVVASVSHEQLCCMPLLQRILRRSNSCAESHSSSSGASTSSQECRDKSHSGSESEGTASTSGTHQSRQSQSQSDKSSGDISPDNGGVAAALKLQMKRQRQTAKARAASLASKALRRLAKTAIVEAPKHKAEAYREDVKADNTLARPGAASGSQGIARRRRLRLLVSYLQGWVAAVMSFFPER